MQIKMSRFLYCNIMQGLLVMYGTAFIPSIISVCFDGDEKYLPAAVDNQPAPSQNDHEAEGSQSASIQGENINNQNGRTTDHAPNSNRGSLTSDDRNQTARSEWTQLARLICNSIAALFQLSVIVVFVAIGASRDKSDIVWSVPLSLVLVSSRSWFNYVGKEATFTGRLQNVHKTLTNLRAKIHASKVVNQLIAGVWKIVLTLALLPFLVGRHLQPDRVRDAGASSQWSAVFQLSMG